MTEEQTALVEEHLRLAPWIVIHKLAFVYENRWMSKEDAIGCANLALCKAAVKFDPARGKFATFASRVIYNDVLDQAHRKGKKHSEVLSLDETLTFALAAPGDAIDDMLVSTMLHDISIKDYTRKWLKGETQNAIAKQIGFTQSYVNRLIKKDLKRVRDEVVWEG